jgi:hypothetical protein
MALLVWLCFATDQQQSVLQLFVTTSLYMDFLMPVVASLLF